MSLNILVVDDSAIMREVVVKTLSLTGLPLGQIHHASDGAKALKVLEDHWVDMVITDLHMPGMDGQQLVEHLRADPLHTSLPVLVISSDASEPRQLAMRALGTDGYLQKPFAPEELRDLISQVTGVLNERHE